ncbi:MAG: hypothetical protein P8M80_04080, partial [Pirellulaceae bacterium]|nr:hypothetical protein [Pirellulaceae bacterium]
QGGGSLGYSLLLENGVPTFLTRNRGQLAKVVGKKIDASDWTHLAVILDADGVAQIYVNGEANGQAKKVGLISGRPADGLTFGGDGSNLVGNYPAKNGVIGSLKDIRLYWGVLRPKALKQWVAQ